MFVLVHSNFDHDRQSFFLQTCCRGLPSGRPNKACWSSSVCSSTQGLPKECKIGSASSLHFVGELVNVRGHNMSLLFFVKLFSTIALFVVFFTIFGLSSIQKYIQRDIVTVSRTDPSGCLPPPAIMVCPKGEYGGAWKINCHQHAYNQTEMDVCSRKHAYMLNETILETSVLARNGTRKGPPNIWTSTYTTPYVGTCYTLKARQHCLSSGDALAISFKVNDIRSYSITLFDPMFFMIKQDNSVIPFLLLDNPMSKAISLQSTLTSKLNRPKFTCNPEKSYSYNQCVKTNLAQKIGCKNPFDGLKDILNVPSCNTEDLSAHWAANFDIYSANQQKLFNITGCEIPCNYIHYSVVGTPVKDEVKGSLYISLFYTSTDTMRSQEVLLYPFDSLVSEFGGALGLFLGFSFLGLLDIIQTACSNILARLKVDQANSALPDV